MTDRTVTRLVAALARVRDDELRGAADQPDAQMLLREIVSTRIARTSHRRRRFVPLIAAAVIAASAVVVVLLVGTRGHGTAPASAATLLTRTAQVARSQPPVTLGPGQ